jgi:hypothetical protein
VVLLISKYQAGNMGKNTAPEKIIREHRKWTQWIETPRKLHLGNLVITNRRLIFLNVISSSPEVTENIKKLADAPTESVLNYAYTLNKDNFQMPLSSIVGLKIGAYNWTPIPHICLSIAFIDHKNNAKRVISFQFIRPYKQTIFKPQFFLVLDWIRDIKNAINSAETNN